jgi:hypothetical protein
MLLFQLQRYWAGVPRCWQRHSLQQVNTVSANVAAALQFSASAGCIMGLLHIDLRWSK